MPTCRWPECQADALPGKLYCTDHRMTGAKGLQRSGRTRGGLKRGGWTGPDERGNQQNPSNDGDGTSNPDTRSGGDGEPAGGGGSSGGGGKGI